MIKPPLSLYVHLPWCVRKCPYCDFNSHSAGDGAPTTRYIEALLLDLDSEASRAEGRLIQSVFLGGGTPSLFSPAEVERLIEAASERLSFVDDIEITMEANPGTVECGAPRGYREAGVNRLSIGAQSFDDESLGRLGRIHSAEDIKRTVADVVDAGFDNFNLDLMHGLPGQTVDKALADIDAAIALEPTHISWYQLTLEPNTVFHARPPADLPGEDTLHAIQEAGAVALQDASFEQYEVSAWARDRRRCRHNVNYWLFGDYLAAGAGAHGKLSGREGVMRYHKPANPLQYMMDMERGGGEVTSETIAATDLPFEFMMNALRLADGFRDEDFTRRTGLSAADLAAAMKMPLEKGLIERIGRDKWRPSRLGRRFLNDLQAQFLT